MNDAPESGAKEPDVNAIAEGKATRRKAAKPKSPRGAAKKTARGRRPENPITKTEMWCRPHNRMHPRSEFAPSFIKRKDFRCKAAFKAAYGDRGVKPKAGKKARAKK
ncbi:MAG: hypothetical protein WA005_12500 [Candidatus Binataceae bacterium]